MLLFKNFYLTKFIKETKVMSNLPDILYALNSSGKTVIAMLRIF